MFRHKFLPQTQGLVAKLFHAVLLAPLHGYSPKIH